MHNSESTPVASSGLNCQERVGMRKSEACRERHEYVNQEIVSVIVGLCFVNNQSVVDLGREG